MNKGVGSVFQKRLFVSFVFPVWVLARTNSQVRESGQPVGDARGLKQLRRGADHVVLEVHPGSYRFDVQDGPS